MACDKGVSKLPATCNYHPHVGKVIPAEGLVLTDLSIVNYLPVCGVKLMATCNCLPHAGKELSAEDQVSNGSRYPKAGTNVPWGIGNVHAINVYRMGKVPLPTEVCAMK